MAQKLLADLSTKVSTTTPNISGGLSQIIDVIKGIKELVAQYKSLNGNLIPSLPPTAPDNLQENKGVKMPSDVLTVSQVKEFLKSFIDNLVEQGYGDKTLSQALSEVPFTIKQIALFIKKK